MCPEEWLVGGGECQVVGAAYDTEKKREKVELKQQEEVRALCFEQSLCPPQTHTAALAAATSFNVVEDGNRFASAI